MWHTAVVSKLTHLLETSTEAFVFTLHLVWCAWLRFQVRTGRAESTWNGDSTAAAGEAAQGLWDAGEGRSASFSRTDFGM